MFLYVLCTVAIYKLISNGVKISKNLPQFRGEKVLLVVTGQQEADFFRAGDGSIEKIAGFMIEKPHYSDRGGHFKRRGHGATLASGSVYENQKEKVLQDFRREFKKTLKNVLIIIPDHIYVYTPPYLVAEISAMFPKRIAGTIKKVIRGNFYGRHPFEFLEKIRIRR